MRKFIASAFLALTLVVASVGQQKDDLSKFEPIGRSAVAAYMANVADAKASPGGGIVFTTLIARIDEVDDANKRVYLDQDNLVFLTLSASCFTYKYKIVNRHGVLDGKPFNTDIKDAKEEQAPKDSVIYKIIDTVCTLKVGQRA
jgi:hypothetical protein